MQTSQEKNKSSAVHKNSTPQAKLLKIERDFNVPIEKLFAAFTNAEILKIWWWPNGLHADHVDLDFREGGKYFFNMKGLVNGFDTSGGMTGQFEEIITNKRIVMTDNFSDINGNAISAKEANMQGVWPEVIYITYDFEAVDENTTHFTLSQEGIPNEMQKDCIQGWSESFDKLQKYLNSQKT